MAGAGAAGFDHSGDEPLDGRGFPENPWSLLPVCGGAHHGTLTVLQIHLTTKVAFLIRTESKVGAILGRSLFSLGDTRG